VYRCLQEAIHREHYDPNKVANDPILWTNKGYAKPALTLVGRALPKALSKYLPIGHSQLEDSYKARGAKTSPTTEHWRYFFREIHEKYATGDRAVERDDNAFILDAYA
jgi:hypothetical protein